MIAASKQQNLSKLIRAISVLIGLLAFSTTAVATEIIESNLTVRGLGMGGVLDSIARDTDAIFFHPAALGMIDGLRLQIVDLGLGVNGTSAYSDLQTANNNTATLANYAGKRYWLGLNGKTALAIPRFGFGAYDNGYLDISVQNPVLPQLNTTYINDWGYYMAYGQETVPGLYIGMALKQVNRVGGTQVIPVSNLANSLTNLADQFQDKGVGYGLDLSMIYQAKTTFQPAFHAIYHDIGATTFRKQTGTNAPPRIEPNVTFGFTTLLDLPGLDWTNAIEYRYAGNVGDTYDATKKIHLGTELSLPFIDLRAGVNQGWATYGVGINVLLGSLDIAYYDVEMGGYAGQDNQNRIMVSFSMELSFDVNFNITGINGKGGPRRKLKLRR